MATAQKAKTAAAHVYDVIYEHERGGLFGGWSSDELIPSTDPPAFTDDHNAATTKETFPLCAGWEWDGDWEVSVDDRTTDGQGWQYAVTWHAQWQREMKPSMFVRRRRWVRARHWTGGTEPMSPIAVVSPPVPTPTPAAEGSESSPSRKQSAEPLTEEERQFLTSKPHMEQQALLTEAIERKKRAAKTTSAWARIQRPLSGQSTSSAEAEPVPPVSRSASAPQTDVGQLEVATVPQPSSDATDKEAAAPPEPEPRQEQAIPQRHSTPAAVSGVEFASPPPSNSGTREARDSLKAPRAAEVKVCVYENQRSSPLGNFSTQWLIWALDKRTQWSFKDGSPCPAPSDYELVPGWEWVDEWSHKAGTRKYDAGGWQYAFSFWDTNWSNAVTARTFVRRRKWTRTRRMIIVPGQEHLAMSESVPVHDFEAVERRGGKSKKGQYRYTVKNASVGRAAAAGIARLVDVDPVHVQLLLASVAVLVLCVLFNWYLSSMLQAVENEYGYLLPRSRQRQPT